jgi:hypothetical protein
MNRNLHQSAKIIAVILLLTISKLSLAQSNKGLEISPYLFGQNHWLADGDQGRVGYLHNLWPKVQESGVTLVRIGGNGYEREFPSRTKLNAMVDAIKGIGAEPLLQLPRQFSELQTEELVKYYTRGNKRHITYWSIGNEPMLHKEQTIEQVHGYLLRIANAMKEAAPDIKIMAFDEAWMRMPEYGDLIGGRLDITGLKKNGKWLFDGVTFHSYPNGAKFTRDDVVFTGPKKILDQIQELKALIKAANEKHQRVGDAALSWAMTEFNVTYANPNREVSGHGNPSFLAGQFTAEIFGYGMEYDAFTMNLWCINEPDAVRTDFGYLGIPNDFYPRSSYYHMQMMSSSLKGDFLASSDNQDYVKTIASTDKETVAIMVMNQHQTNDYKFSLGFNGTNSNAEKSLVINIPANLKKTFDGEIAAQSTHVYVFTKKGKLQKKITYSLANNLENAPPTIEEF